jgi:hypothetical protein
LRGTADSASTAAVNRRFIISSPVGQGNAESIAAELFNQKPRDLVGVVTFEHIANHVAQHFPASLARHRKFGPWKKIAF